MSGRYVARIDAALEREWALARTPPIFESYNVAPGHSVPAIREKNGQRVCELIRWGLVPYWAKGVPPTLSTVNARIETVATAEAYSLPWHRGQRCILPALGFYEWQVGDRRKQPYYITLSDQPVFGMAGLWDHSATSEGIGFDSCAIITLPANAMLAHVLNADGRMPAILRREDHDAWLTGTVDQARACLQPYLEMHMRAHAVSTVVNSPRNNEARLIEALPESRPEQRPE